VSLADQLDSIINDHFADIAGDLRQVFDEVSRTHHDDPVEVIKTALRAGIDGMGLSIVGSELASCAETIAAGDTIDIDIPRSLTPAQVVCPRPRKQPPGAGVTPGQRAGTPDIDLPRGDT
jgi:hypothetical protein